MKKENMMKASSILEESSTFIFGAELERLNLST
jgi:hypothetical protein